MNGFGVAVRVLCLVAFFPVAAQGQYEGYQIIETTDTIVGQTARSASWARCPAGKVVINGGFRANCELEDAEQMPKTDQIGHFWLVNVRLNPAVSDGCNLEVSAICVNAQQRTGGTPTPDTAPADNFRNWLLNGNPLYAVLDVTPTDIGSAQKGGTYRITYNGGEFTATGPSIYHGGDDITAAYSNADLQAYEVSIWGRVFRFDGDGQLWDIHGGNANDPILVGHVKR